MEESGFFLVSEYLKAQASLQASYDLGPAWTWLKLKVTVAEALETGTESTSATLRATALGCGGKGGEAVGPRASVEG